MSLLFKEADHQPAKACIPHVRPDAKPRRRSSAKTRRISLALQGGGAFGAFTWGVLDRLLKDGSIAFDAVSGAGAGAMNALLLASGLARGGQQEARASLDRFWRKVSKVGRKSAFAPPDAILAAMTQSLSPYQFNPLDLNPLRDILTEEIAPDLLRTKASVRLVLYVKQHRPHDSFKRRRLPRFSIPTWR